jgi:hypothetical protein
LDEVNDQDDHGDDQKDMDETAADVGKQAEQPENGDNDGYPKQHKYLLGSSADGILRPVRTSYGLISLRQRLPREEAPR